MVQRKVSEMAATGQSAQVFIEAMLRVRADMISRLEIRKTILEGKIPTIPPPPSGKIREVPDSGERSDGKNTDMESLGVRPAK